MLSILFKNTILLALASRLATALPSQSQARGAPVPCRISQELVGDGSPVQHILNRQVSEGIQCNEGDQCGVTYGKEHSLTFEWSFGLEGPGDASFLSAGFAVSESWTDSQQYTCQAHTQQTACVWYAQAYTEYTVRNVYFGDCLGDINVDPYTIVAPNTDNKGSHGYDCRINEECQTFKTERWDKNKCAGGPGSCQS
ncbi:hypothetical protein F5Y17DRAFT_206988 [Xylariaceae sp. FL0594]|nr:hypothetical protein F5Y17DRAFT_206988 [Xylariaceae sp. FL0594]